MESDSPTPAVAPAMSPPEQGRSPRRRVRAEQGDLAVAWMAAALIGGAAISLMPESVGAWRNLAPLAAMAAYLMFAFSRSRYSTLRVADSAYFMGFLWTLWALITALVWNKDLKAADLYPVFGYALITTASGMFVRMALIQFYRTAEDQSEQAVDQIDLRVESLAKELERSQEAAADLREKGTTALQQWHTRFTEASDGILAETKQMAAQFAANGRDLSASIKQVNQTVASTGRLFTALEKRLSASTERIAGGIDKSAESLDLSVSRLVKRVDEVQVPVDLIQAKLTAVIESIENAVAPTADKAKASVEELAKSVRDVAQAIIDLPKKQELQTGITSLIEKLNLVVTACEELRRTAHESAGALSSIGPAASQIVNELKNVKSQVGEIQKGLGSAHATVASVENDAKKAGGAITEVVRFVRANVTDRA